MQQRLSLLLALLSLFAMGCPDGVGIGLRVGIAPDEPTDGDPLNALILTTPAGEGTWSYDYAWFQNGDSRADLTTDTVPAAETNGSDTWRLVVTPTLDDGTVGEEAEASVTIAAGPSDNDDDGFDSTVDCDDNNPDINPNAVEVCNGQDDDCNEVIDDGTTGDFRDDDDDGFDNCSDDGVPGGEGTDCNDQNPDVNPDATETCNGNADDDCDGVDDPNEVDDDTDMVTECAGDCDDDDPTINPLDADSDGASTCDPNPDCDDTDPALNLDDIDTDGFTSCDGDCDDDDPAANLDDVDTDGVTTCGPDGVFGTDDDDCDDNDIDNFPGNVEACDGEDNDCDGQIENGTANVDLDAFTVCEGDCDDGDPNVFPGATEVCDGVDNDCANGVDDGFDDIDNDGVAVCVDCDDNDPNSFPGGTEVCDGADNDCANGVDDGFDGDTDTYTTCGADGIPGNADDDCDDGDPGINPGATEACDAVDEDCDGTIDNGFDGDTDLVTTCGPDGISGTTDDDCDDTDPGIFPGAVESIDGEDEDCDGFIDEYTWTQVQSLIAAPSCGCHNGASGSGGLSLLSGGAGWANVVNTPSSQQPSLDRVDPGDSTNSYLFMKVTGAPGISGGQMPLSGGLVSADNVTGLKNWIDAGAAND